MNLFITGTDTDVGKTIVSSWICMKTKSKYWKPIQTGDDSDSEIVSKFAKETTIIPNVYKLKAPLSPYDSANLERRQVDVGNITKSIPDKTVIEGAGGALVPISEGFYMADLIKPLNAKALIVAKSRLGFLNHIFLTVEILRAKNIDILGIIINCDVESFLIKTIEKFSGTSVLQVIPQLDNLEFGLENVELPDVIAEVLK